MRNFFKEERDLLTYKESDDRMKMKNFYKIDRSGTLLKVNEREHKKEKKATKPVDLGTLNVGYYLIIPILIGIFLGLVLDEKFKTRHMFTGILIFAGGIASFYNLWKLVKKS